MVQHRNWLHTGENRPQFKGFLETSDCKVIIRTPNFGFIYVHFCSTKVAKQSDCFQIKKKWWWLIRVRFGLFGSISLAIWIDKTWKEFSFLEIIGDNFFLSSDQTFWPHSLTYHRKSNVLLDIGWNKLRSLSIQNQRYSYLLIWIYNWMLKTGAWLISLNFPRKCCLLLVI